MKINNSSEFYVSMTKTILKMSLNFVIVILMIDIVIIVTIYFDFKILNAHQTHILQMVEFGL